MAYQTGVATSPTNLLQTLVTWLVGQGWTADASASDGAGWRALLHKNGLYVNLRAAMNEELWPAVPSGFHDEGTGGYGIGLYLGDGYSGAAAWHLQSGRPTRPDGSTLGFGMNLPSGSIAAYHFFDNGADHITVVVERSPGLFTHMGWGPSMVKVGFTEDFPYVFGATSAYRNTVITPGSTFPADPVPGLLVTADAPMSHSAFDPRSVASGTNYGDQNTTTALVRVDASTWSGRWISNGQRETSAYGYSGRFMRCALNQSPVNGAGGLEAREYPDYEYIAGRAHQVAFAGALLLPLHCYVLTVPGDRWAPVGWPPSVFYSNAVGNGFTAGQVYQVGGEDFMLFPNFAVRKAA
jgi:hypothetical protein